MSIYVVAGVTGHIGAVVATQLLAKGKKVRAIVRDAKKGEALAQAGAELAVGSLDDAAFLTTALTGATSAFLLVPPPYGATDFRAAQKKVVDAQAHAVTHSKIPHVVLLSSIGAQHAAGTGPIVGLHLAEEALKKTAATLTIIRAGSFMENVDNLLGAAMGAGILPNFASEEYPQHLIATADIAQLVVESLLSPPAKTEVVGLDGENGYRPADIAEIVSKAIGKPVQVMTVPQAGWVGAMTQSGVPAPMAEQFAEMYDGAAKGLLTLEGVDRHVKGKLTLGQVINTSVKRMSAAHA